MSKIALTLDDQDREFLNEKANRDMNAEAIREGFLNCENGNDWMTDGVHIFEVDWKTFEAYIALTYQIYASSSY